MSTINDADFAPTKPTFKDVVYMSIRNLTNFPYIEKDFDAITDYELLCKVVEHLNNLISNNNTQNSTITGLYNAYVALQDYVNDYFNDLDVQDEINKKLDEMAQDGSLTQLIKDYVDPIYEAYENSINNAISFQNTRITNVENELSSVASGSPKGTYATTAALISANPDTGVYVITADGHAYSWTKNGDSPIDLGVYQATEIEDGELTVYKTDFYEIKSLIPRTNWTSGKMLASSTGNEYSGTGSYNAGYISVTSRKGMLVFNDKLSTISLTVCCYDSNKDFISSVIPATSNQYVVTLPANTAYVRFSISGSNFTTLPNDVAMFITLTELLNLRSYEKTNQIIKKTQTNLSSDEIIIPNNRKFFILPTPSMNGQQYPNVIKNPTMYECLYQNTTSTTYNSIGVRFYAENLQVGDKIYVNIAGTTDKVSNVNLYPEDNYTTIYHFINEYNSVYSLELTSEMITKINTLITNNLYPKIHVLYDGLTTNSTVTTHIKAWINNDFCTASNGFENIGTRLAKLEEKRNYKVLYLGDSITALTGTSGWWTYFNEIIGVTQYQNVAVAGAHLADYSDSVYDGNPVLDGPDNNHNNVLGNQVQKVINNQDTYITPDFIIIAIGTNDGITTTLNNAYAEYYNQNGSIKALTDVDRQTSAGAFRYCNEKLHELYPDAMIVWCTPIQASNTIRNVKNVIEWGDNLKLLCSFGSNFCIDTEKCGICGINEINGSNGEDLADGLHPNSNGAKKMGTFNACEFKKFLDRVDMYNSNN